jgi:dTDP-4-amino-4,6-dideoxygalactose transaminase
VAPRNLMPSIVEGIPTLDLRAQYESIRDEIKMAIDAVLESQHFILGPEVEALEREIASYVGSKFGVGVASGTDALILALKACDVGAGDEVLCPSFTFIATADAVSLLGAKPVFIDIDPKTFTMDPLRLEKAISPRTKAVIPVHLYGQAADIDAVGEIAAKHNLRVIEDCAQAIGATYKGKRVGTFGDLGCFSFFPSKNLGGYGDGGMVVTDSELLAKRLRSLRSHGTVKKYFSVEQGWNSRLDEIQAAILRVKLRHLESWAAARRETAARYDTLLRDIPEVTRPVVHTSGTHVFHQYTIRHSNREFLQTFLAEAGIATAVYYPTPIHLQPIYRSLGYQLGDLPKTEKAAYEVLSLPIYPELTEVQVQRIASSLMDASRECLKQPAPKVDTAGRRC